MKRGYHGKVTSVNQNIAILVHTPKKPTLTQKMKEGLKFFISTFESLIQRNVLKSKRTPQLEVRVHRGKKYVYTKVKSTYTERLQVRVRHS